MLTPLPDFIPTAVSDLLAPFKTVFIDTTLTHATSLLCGSILACGRRTVTAALRVMGLATKKNFSKYHRVFSRAVWSPFGAARLLLGQLVDFFVPADARITIIMDSTLEKRWGPKVPYKGFFRDAVASTVKKVIVSPGIQWLCACVSVNVPWCTRRWALPFLAVPVRSKKCCEKTKKGYVGTLGWACSIIGRLRRWLPGRKLELSVDGGFGSAELVLRCQSFAEPVRLICRCRMDARLYDWPEPQHKGKRGPKPKKGKRQAKPEERLHDPNTRWQNVCVRWYDGKDKKLEVATGKALWHTPSQEPAPVRWLLVRCPDDPRFEPGVFLCSEIDADPKEILMSVIARWAIEVTFEETRAHLGWGTQRHFCARAVGRITPCLLGEFSMVACLAKQLGPDAVSVRKAAWYDKTEPTFSDVLAAVRAHLWDAEKYINSPKSNEMCLIPRGLLQRLSETVCYAA